VQHNAEVKENFLQQHSSDDWKGRRYGQDDQIKSPAFVLFSDSPAANLE
jgi:hypothetical protein